MNELDIACWQRVFERMPEPGVTPAIGLGDRPDTLVDGERLADVACLHKVVAHHAAACGARGCIAAACSMWSKYHLSALAQIWVLGAMLCNELPTMQLPACAVEMDDAGRCRRLWPRGVMVRPQRDPEPALAALRAQHLEPLLGALSTVSGLSPRVFWSNFAVYAAYFVNLAGRHPQCRDAVRETFSALFARRRLADGGANPLYRPVHMHPEAGQSPVRRLCCMRYLGGAWDYCSNCPHANRNGRNCSQQHIRREH